MFKIANLKQVSDEKVSINLIKLKNNYKNNKKISCETFKTLSFDIFSDNCNFSFTLNCKLEKLLEIPINETIDFKNYILESTFNIKGIYYIDQEINIKITRYLKNKFIIFLTFYTDYNENDYFGLIELTFNLDDYLK